MIATLVLPQDRKSQAALFFRLVQTVCRSTRASAVRQLSCRTSWGQGKSKKFKELLTKLQIKIMSRFFFISGCTYVKILSYF